MRGTGWLSLTLAGTLQAVVGCTVQELPDDRPSDIAALHADALVWDAHNDLAYRVLYEGLDIGQRLPAGHVDLQLCRRRQERHL